jgi:branched-chain amino acid transport system permease protein
LGLAEALRIAMLSSYQVTGGAQGLLLPIPKNFIVIPYYYFSLLLLLATILGKKIYLRSRLGLALTAIREEEDAAEALGVNVFKYKLLTFMLSALFVGLAGGFYAYYMSYVEPNNLFGIFWSLIPVFMVIIGGVRIDTGPLVGAAFYVALPEIIAGFGFGADASIIAFGAALIVVIIVRPAGLSSNLGR